MVYICVIEEKKKKTNRQLKLELYLGGTVFSSLEKSSIAKKKIYHTLQCKLSEGFKICYKTITMYKDGTYLYKTNTVTEIAQCEFLWVTKQWIKWIRRKGTKYFFREQKWEF